MTSFQSQIFFAGKMAQSRIMMLCFVCFVTISLLQVVKCQSIRIVQPYPSNVYPIEGTEASTTCIAQGETDEVRFVRRTPSGRFAKYPESERVFTTNYTKGDKIYFTLTFKEIKIEDDSTVERYECWAHKIGDKTEEWDDSAKHGFNVQVIKRSSVPTIIPDTVVIVERNRGDTFSIACNTSIPDKPLDVRPTSMHWLKNNVTKQSIYTHMGRFLTNLKPLVFTSVTPEDGGNYTCTLETLLKLARPYTITGGPYIIKIRPTFTSKNLDDNEITGYKGKSANFSCSAVGFPLTVKWEMKLGDEKIWKDVVSDENDTHYQRIPKQDYEAPNLKINDIQYSDRGLYRCCIVHKNGTGQCQKFALCVGDPNMSNKPTSQPTCSGHAQEICDHFLIIMCIAFFCSLLRFKIRSISYTMKASFKG